MGARWDEESEPATRGPDRPSAESITEPDRAPDVTLEPASGDLRQRIYRIVFEADTPAGRAFDVLVFGLILLSIAVVVLESVPQYASRYGTELRATEWALTGLFTAEYAARLYCARRRLAYALSFFGVIDLVALLPSYLSLFLTGTQALLVVRSLRLLRLFRVIGLRRYAEHGESLNTALRASLPKILVFLTGVLMVVVIIGSMMHIIENDTGMFETIPHGMYWAVTTLTTVGYGDLVPKTPMGRFLASVVMLLGYGVIAVPTGIVSTEMARAVERRKRGRTCRHCDEPAAASDSRFCHICGTNLSGPQGQSR